MVILLALACTSPKGQDSAALADTGAPVEDALPQAWSEFYEVQSVIRAGGYRFDEAYWARRDVDPAGATIIEEFIAQADGTVTLTRLDVDATAGTFTLIINDGEYTGLGNLRGEAWDWDAWDSESTAGDGSYVLSEDRRTETGIEAAKEGFGVDGELEWTIEEVLVEVTQGEWQVGVEGL